jgi:hypothetical protein
LRAMGRRPRSYGSGDGFEESLQPSAFSLQSLMAEG